ncbi:hypothetical protein UlMin_039005 [Ulmus minor]
MNLCTLAFDLFHNSTFNLDIFVNVKFDCLLLIKSRRNHIRFHIFNFPIIIKFTQQFNSIPRISRFNFLGIKWTSPEDNFNKFFFHYWTNNNAVRTALHVQKGTTQLWITCNRKLLFTRRVFSLVGYHEHLNDRGYRALIYSGDHDMFIPYIGRHAWIKTLNLLVVTSWRPWLFEDQVAVYVTEYSNDFTFSTLKGGGHAIVSQHKEYFAMYKRWISQEPLRSFALFKHETRTRAGN